MSRVMSHLVLKYRTGYTSKSRKNTIGETRYPRSHEANDSDLSGPSGGAARTKRQTDCHCRRQAMESLGGWPEECLSEFEPTTLNPSSLVAPSLNEFI